MNINLLKTFAEVARLRHFGKTADKVCLTQSAVSARIKQLEDVVGVQLLSRTRNNIQLTPEGRKLALVAEDIVKKWEQTKNELRLAGDPEQQLLRLGMVYDIWSILSPVWLGGTQNQHTQLLFQLHVFSASLLQERLLSDELDASIMFEPPHHPGLEIMNIGDIELILVSASKPRSIEEPISDYIFVDWGERFSDLHQQQLGDKLYPMLSVNISSMALDYLLTHGGMAYLSRQQSDKWIAEGKLFEVKDAPDFQREVFYVYRKNHPWAEILKRITPTLH